MQDMSERVQGTVLWEFTFLENEEHTLSLACLSQLSLVHNYVKLCSSPTCTCTDIDGSYLFDGIGQACSRSGVDSLFISAYLPEIFCVFKVYETWIIV